jgi:hypothetical protein
MGLTKNLGTLAQGVFSDSSLNIGIGGAPSGSFKFEVTGTGRFSGALSGTSATFTGILTAGSSLSQTPASISTNSQANQPALTLFKNIFTGTGEDVFRIQSFTSGVVNVFTVKDNGATALSGALSGTSATFSSNVTISGSGSNNHNLIFDQQSGSNNIFQGIDFKDGNALIRSAIRQEQTNYAFGLTDLVFYNGATSLPERMRLFSSGNFAIGASTDGGDKLQVSGSAIISAINTPLIVNSTNSNGGKLLFRDAGNNSGYIGATTINSFIVYSSIGNPQFYINNSTGEATLTGTIGDRLYLYNSGNNSGTNGIYIDSDIYPAIRFNNRVGNPGTAKIVYNTYATGYGAASLNGSFLMQGPNALQFSSGGDNVRLTIASTGEATFSGSLTMSAYSYASTAIQFTRAASNLVTPASGNGILVFAGGNAQMRMDTANQICFDMNNGGNPHTVLTLKQSDNTVSINSPNNGLPLELKYQNVASGYLGASGSALYAYSTNGGYVLLNASSVWVAASDAKRKRNFETYSNGLSAILGLQPKLYNMDFQKDGDEKQVGLVAQEVKDFIPKAYEDNNNFIGLNYNAIIVTMVNAIKELKAEIDILKNN